MSHETERPLPGCQPACGCAVARAIPHLPAIKQRQLGAIVWIIRATADVERVILYGSHARGDWVEDPVGGYLSDLDILVLVAYPALAADESLWADCQDLAREVAGDTPVSLIAHTVDDVRQQLARGSSFFRDIMTEGVALYDAGHIAIAVPELTPARHHALAESCFQPSALARIDPGPLARNDPPSLSGASAPERPPGNAASGAAGRMRHERQEIRHQPRESRRAAFDRRREPVLEA
jgi:hypothetical protein